MALYSDLGGDKQLNEIVIAGSHDAGITTGAGNAQTQNVDILGQAIAGVRFFDIRVAAFATGAKSFGAKQVELKSFHADDMIHSKDAKTRSVVGLQGSMDLQRSKLRGGTEGLSLRKILQDARAFVESAMFSGEFLILKFDKCTNWKLIAETCRNVLGNRIYSDGGNVNIKTLDQLAGKVVVAFMPSGYAELKLPIERAGITPITNLYKPPAAYAPNFHGIQYWGAGGTDPFTFSSDKKIRENVEKQTKILAKAASGIAPTYSKFKRKLKDPGCPPADPNAMGMMYWTSTGVFESIKGRDDTMWDDDHVGGLETIWKSGFDSYISNAVPSNVDLLSFSSGGTLKLFMPNIVMIDFADHKKCAHIYKLNKLAATKLTAQCRKLDLYYG
jgi:hypothetical protein